MYLNDQLCIVSGTAKGYEDILQGYHARSRQQSLDRRGGAEQERKIPEKIEKKATTSDVSKPPTAPRRKREK